jgi:hypothetical protein
MRAHEPMRIKKALLLGRANMYLKWRLTKCLAVNFFY